MFYGLDEDFNQIQNISEDICMTKKYTNITYASPLSSKSRADFYVANGIPTQIITTKKKDGTEKITDIRVALTHAQYEKLREKCKIRHISKFESITPLDVTNEVAELNRTVETINERQNPSAKTRLLYPVTSFLYKWRWRAWSWQGWNNTALETIQGFIHHVKEKLLDTTIDLHALRNNPRSLLRKEDLDNLDIKKQNINELILKRLKDKINEFKAKITDDKEKFGIKDSDQLKKLASLRKIVGEECDKFIVRIQTLIDNGAREKDIKILFQNKNLGNFIKKCEFLLIDRLDKIVRDMDGNAYWDLWDLHPARKFFSRIKRKIEARSSLEGAQTIAERPVSQEMLDYLSYENDEDVQPVSVDADESKIDDEFDVSADEPNKERFWVSLSPYVDQDFSLPEVEEIFNTLTPDKTGLNKIQGTGISWTAGILLASFIWEPIPIILRLASSVFFTIPSVVTHIVEKGLSTLQFKKAAEWVGKCREFCIEWPNAAFGRFCEKFSLTLYLKKKRGEESLDRNPDRNDTLSQSFASENNIPLNDIQKRQAFLKRLNKPVNQMHVLANKYFSPSEWGKSITELATSVMASPFSLARELWENRRNSEKPEEVYKRVVDETDKWIREQVEEVNANLADISPSENTLDGSRDSSSDNWEDVAVGELSKETKTLQSICEKIEQIAIVARANQTTDVQSFAKVGHEVVRVLADELVNNFLCESPGVTTAGAAAAVSTLGLSLFPSLVASLKLTAILSKAQILPEALGKNVMGQGLSEGTVAKIFAAFLEYKAIALTGDGIKAVINGDLGIFRTIFHNPERIAFGFICCTAVGVALSSIPGTVSLSLWEDATGMEEVQGPYVFLINFFLDEAHHAKRAAIGADLVPYSFLGLKSLMLFKSLTDGKEKRKYQNVVGRFFAAWRNSKEGLKTPLEEMLKTQEGEQFLLFWNKYFHQTAENLVGSVNSFNDKLKLARDKLKTLKDAKPEEAAKVVSSGFPDENKRTDSDNQSRDTFEFVPSISPSRNPSRDITEHKKIKTKQSAYQELMEAINWLDVRGDCLIFKRDKTFFNSEPYKFYDHLYQLFKNYNDLADFDERIDGTAFLKDFYSKYCYEGSNNFLRSAIWLGNVLLITPIFRNVKYALLSHSPAMREQYRRSKEKDYLLAEEFVATAGRVTQATLRLTSYFVVGALGTVPFVVGGILVSLEKGGRAAVGMETKSTVAYGLKAAMNWLSDRIKLHYLSSGLESSYGETANTAATTHDFPTALEDVKKRAGDVSKSVMTVNVESDKSDEISLRKALQKLHGREKVKALDRLERLTHMQKETISKSEDESAVVASEPDASESSDKDPLQSSSTKTVSKISEQRVFVRTGLTGFFRKELVTKKERELRLLPPEVADHARKYFRNSRAG